MKRSFRNLSWSKLSACSLQMKYCNKMISAASSTVPSRPESSTAIDSYPSTLSSGFCSEDISSISDDIRKVLYQATDNSLLRQLSVYHFDGEGKAVRPLLCCLMAQAVNSHQSQSQAGGGYVLDSQRQVAMIAEMIHTASLVHDDVIDGASMRRGRTSLVGRWGEKRAVMTGNFILAVASTMLARLGNDDVTEILSQVVADLVQGEFMQLGAREKENERFAHYLEKTFKKTASLMALSCKAVALLGGADSSLQEAAYQYGRNVGVAFQLVDDMLDFSATSRQLGKPAAVDLRLGLATAPVLFACEQFPELNAMVMRRFTCEGDVAFAIDCVAKSDALRQSRILAASHCSSAVHSLSSQLSDSSARQQLIRLADHLLSRAK